MMELLLLLVLLVVYLAPTITASSRNHRQATPIFILNLFFGWTFVGWIICLAWAYSSDVTN